MELFLSDNLFNQRHFSKAFSAIIVRSVFSYPLLLSRLSMPIPYVYIYIYTYRLVSNDKQRARYRVNDYYFARGSPRVEYAATMYPRFSPSSLTSHPRGGGIEGTRESRKRNATFARGRGSAEKSVRPPSLL